MQQVKLQELKQLKTDHFPVSENLPSRVGDVLQDVTGVSGSSWESDGAGLAHLEMGEVETEEVPTLNDTSFLPLHKLRLLSSFSYSSAANFSKYLYLKVKFQRDSVKKKKAVLDACLWIKHLQEKTWLPDTWDTVQLTGGLIFFLKQMRQNHSHTPKRILCTCQTKKIS